MKIKDYIKYLEKNFDGESGIRIEFIDNYGSEDFGYIEEHRISKDKINGDCVIDLKDIF